MRPRVCVWGGVTEVASISVNTAESGDPSRAWKLQAKQTLGSQAPIFLFPSESHGHCRVCEGNRLRGSPGRRGFGESGLGFAPPSPPADYGLCPGALRRSGGPGFQVQAVLPGAGGAPVHAVRTRLLRQLPAALGGSAAPVPVAVPAPGAGQAVPGAASAQPHPEAAHPVRLPRPRLRPLGPAARAGGARRALRLPPCPPPAAGRRLGAGRPRRRERVRAGGLRNRAGAPPGRGRARGAAGRPRRERAGARAASPLLESAREGAASAALGAAGRGAAHGPQVPGEVRPVHGSRPQLRQRPGRRPRPGKRRGIGHLGTVWGGKRTAFFWYSEIPLEVTSFLTVRWEASARPDHTAYTISTFWMDQYCIWEGLSPFHLY